MINQNNLKSVKSKRIWWWVLGAVVFLLLLFILWPTKDITLNSPVAKTQKIDETVLYNQSKDEPHQGDVSAKVRILEFGDFECSYCGQAFSIVREILQKYQGKIYFAFRDFPLINDHPNALNSALAVGCANEQGKFWEMHDKLFINQANLTDADLLFYAQAVGLNTVQFNSCFKTEKYLSEINQDIDDGLGFGVRATPTFFINGYKIEGVIPKDLFIQIIEKALAE